jgi:hypothetical protein
MHSIWVVKKVTLMMMKRKLRKNMSMIMQLMNTLIMNMERKASMSTEVLNLKRRMQT